MGFFDGALSSGVTLAKGAGEGGLDEELVEKDDDDKEQAGGNRAQQQLPYLVDEAGFRLCWGRGRREQKYPELMNHCLHAGVDYRSGVQAKKAFKKRFEYDSCLYQAKALAVNAAEAGRQWKRGPHPR